MLILFISGLMSDIVNFTFFHVGYFCISVNILEICSTLQLSYSLMFSGLAFQLCYMVLEHPLFYGNFISILKLNFLKTLPNAPWIMKFSTLPGGNRNHCWLCVSSYYCPSNHFKEFFPQTWVCPSTPALISTELKTQAWLSKGDNCTLPGFPLSVP